MCIYTAIHGMDLFMYDEYINVLIYLYAGLFSVSVCVCEGEGESLCVCKSVCVYVKLQHPFKVSYSQSPPLPSYCSSTAPFCPPPHFCSI